MIDRQLRNVLLIKAIEETDLGGEVIPLADRAAASREALRQAGGGVPPERISSVLHRDAQRLLTMRSERLLQPLLTRYPFLNHLLALIEGPRWITGLLLIICLVLGGAMSAVDGDNRIDVLGFPLLLLVAWNLVVYTLLLVHAARGAAAPVRSPSSPALYARWIAAGTRRLLTEASRFNVPLTAALQRFCTEWLAVSRPALLARGARLFHLCSACVAGGLVVALYFRGIWRGYRAGWDSTWPDLVPPLLRVFYGPAASLTHIALPTPGSLESIRWSAGSGEPAASWIHLMAVTAVLFIVGPRLALAVGCSIQAWRRKRSMPPPLDVTAYYRAVLGPTGLPAGRGIVSIVPYSYEPPPQIHATLGQLMCALFGEGATVDARAPVPFGQEEEFLSRLPALQDMSADCMTLLMNLASTPEDENHGTMLVGLRDRLMGSPSQTLLLVLIDEGPYAARMTAAPERLRERRELWQRFLKDRGVRGVMLDLRPQGQAREVDLATTARVRDALQGRGSS